MDKEKLKREEGRTIGAVKEIEGLLGLKNLNRMEAYDISNLGKRFVFQFQLLNLINRSIYYKFTLVLMRSFISMFILIHAETLSFIFPIRFSALASATNISTKSL